MSSITDNGVGNYTINFTTAMPDANYSAVTTAAAGLIAYGFSTADNSQTAAALTNIFCITHTGAGQDAGQISVAIFR